MKRPRKCEANMMSVRKFLSHKHYHCPASCVSNSISKCVFRQLAKKTFATVTENKTKTNDRLKQHWCTPYIANDVITWLTDRVQRRRPRLGRIAVLADQSPRAARLDSLQADDDLHDLVSCRCWDTGLGDAMPSVLAGSCWRNHPPGTSSSSMAPLHICNISL